MRLRHQPKPRALTLIETLVAIAIIAVLAALLIPAVQMAREAGRRAQCANNLKQLGIAIAGYTTDFGVLPPGIHGGGWSLHVALLPYLEQRSLYDTLNFADKPTTSRFAHGPNRTLSQTKLDIFLCPADSNLPRNWAPPTSYAGNIGFGFDATMLPYHAANNGAISILPTIPIQPKDFTDGTSNTVAMSEWVFSANRPDIVRSVFLLTVKPTDAASWEQSVSICKSIDINNSGLDHSRGRNWYHGAPARTQYTHALPPGSPSCLHGAAKLLGIITAASTHSGGVNTLYVDGHVTATTTSVAPAAWRALGTRAGGDLAGF